MSPKSIRSMLFTRRYYAWESSVEAVKEFGSELFVDTPMNELQELALRVWKEAGETRPIYVRAGRGAPHCKRLFSYCQSTAHEVRIVLSRVQRNKFVLLHEMAHAFGCFDHDAKFAKQHLDLLVKYGRAKRAPLRASMTKHGVL